MTRSSKEQGSSGKEQASSEKKEINRYPDVIKLY
jgi:hypothetical protein